MADRKWNQPEEYGGISNFGFTKILKHKIRQLFGRARKKLVLFDTWRATNQQAKKIVNFDC